MTDYFLRHQGREHARESILGAIGKASPSDMPVILANLQAESENETLPSDYRVGMKEILFIVEKGK